jgi:hypothetical protein
MPPFLAIRQDATTTPTPTPSPPAKNHSNGTPGWAIFIIVLVLMALIGGGLFFFFRLRNKRLDGGAGGPAAPFDTAKSWLSKATYKIRNPRARSGSAGFEGISAGRAGAVRGARGNGGALDPDEAWDTRVGNEADYPGYYGEDTELQGGVLSDGRYETLGHTNTEYAGAAGDNRGRMPAENPFGDENAVGAANPRLTDQAAARQAHHSPTRRSLFKEDV